MDNSIFTSQFQSAVDRLFFQLFESLQQSLQAGQAGTDETAGGWSATAAASSAEGSGSFANLVRETSLKYGVNPNLVDAVIQAESNYNPQAVSSAGAQGLMQLMPATARGLGVGDAFDPSQNVDGGVRLLRQLLDRYQGDVPRALAAYNAGPGAVDRYGGIPPYSETQTYVQRVMNTFQSSFDWRG